MIPRAWFDLGFNDYFAGRFKAVGDRLARGARPRGGPGLRCEIAYRRGWLRADDCEAVLLAERAEAGAPHG